MAIETLTPTVHAFQDRAAQEARLTTQEKEADYSAILASHDQRLKALETRRRRLWKFAPFIISVAALLISLYGAFVKK